MRCSEDVYKRQSKDDDLDGESASIANQRDMLETYCEKHIRHNQKTFGIGIQPSHIIQMAQARRQQVVNSTYGSLRFAAAHIPAGGMRREIRLPEAAA